MNKHFVLTSGRSGSNYISSLLTKHPNVINYGEVLGEWTTGYKVNKYLIGQGDAGKYLDFIYRGKGYFQLSQTYARLKSVVSSRGAVNKKWSDITSYGIKDFAMTLIQRDTPDFLKNNPDIRVINLYRENALRRFASVQLLDETGVVSTDHAQIDAAAAQKLKKQVCLDPNTILADLQRTQKIVQDQLDMVAQLPEDQVLTIRYEDLFASEEAKHDFAANMFKFIGVEPLELSSNHKKLNSDNLKELISNYDEIFDICKGSEFERYFYY